jgi:hypothetical protein
LIIRQLQLASVTELKSNFSEYLRLAEKEDIIVTYRGEPKGILQHFTAGTLEDYVLANHIM